jgi:hypothetical protein
MTNGLQVLSFLESKGFVVSAENDTDNILAKPIALINVDKDEYFFCLKKGACCE